MKRAPAPIDRLARANAALGVVLLVGWLVCLLVFGSGCRVGPHGLQFIWQPNPPPVSGPAFPPAQQYQTNLTDKGHLSQ